MKIVACVKIVPDEEWIQVLEKLMPEIREKLAELIK